MKVLHFISAVTDFIPKVSRGKKEPEKLSQGRCMACKARWVALLLACLLHTSALAQRSSSGGTRSSASRSSETFRATAPPPPSVRAGSSGESTNSGSGGFVTTLGSTSRGTSTETSNSGGSSFGILSTGSSISSLSSGTSSRGSSSQSSESAFPGGGTLTSSQVSSASQSGTNSNGNNGNANGVSGNGNGNGNDGNGNGNGGSSGSSSPSKTSPSPPSPTPTPTLVSAAVGTVTSSTKGCGAGGSTNCAGGNSDPVMYGFAGRAFNFMGEPGNIYNIISTLNIQVSMKLKLAQMWDHNGTNMGAIGFMYRNYKVLVSLDAKEEVVVTAQGRTLKVKNTARHYAWRFDDGAYIQTTWERYKPGLGNTITIETDVIKMTIWQTPAGILDEGGMVLGAWLNFGLSLEAPPANGLMHGIVGGTYDRFIMGETAVSDPKSQLYLPEDGAFHGRYKDEEYAMADHWDTNFPANLFGVTDPSFQAAQQGRSNLEDDTNQSAFPAFARACFLCDQTPSGQSHTF
ncbi:g5817 [Coccomyxa elongata]